MTHSLPRSIATLALAALLGTSIIGGAAAQRYRHDYRGGRDYRGGHRGEYHHNNTGAVVGGALLALGLGAVVGGALAAPSPGYGPPPAAYAPPPVY